MILDVHAELLSMSLQHTVAQKVERLRASPPSGGSVAGGEPPELDQPGLALVERQAELLQPVLEVREELLPIRLELAAEDQSSSGGEFHPSALREPDVKLSPHPAPTLQPPVARRAATGQTDWGPAARCIPASAPTHVPGA